MKTLKFHSFLMAFAMLLSLVGFTACGDDDDVPAPAPNPDTSTNVTSGTLYILEGYMASAFDYANIETSIVKAGEADNFVSISAGDLLSADQVNIVSGDAEEVLKAEMEHAFLSFTPSFRVSSYKITSFPTTFSIKHKATVKGEQTEKRDFGYGEIYLFIDNNNKPHIASGQSRYGQGIRADKVQDGVNLILNSYNLNRTVSLNNGQVSITAGGAE